MNANEFNTWAKRFLWPFNLPPACPVHEMDPGSDACAEWVRDLQRAHGLRVDGVLGPSTIYVCMALYGEQAGSVGGAIIGGEEVDLGTPVVRFFAPGGGRRLAQPPRLGVLLSVASLELTATRRRKGELELRSHFTIESGRGAHGRSLVLQWADPLDEVDFTAHAADESDTYPLGRCAVGVELENPLILHERSHEQRTRQRTREVVTATVAGRRTRQLGLFLEQIAALEGLLDALEASPGVPKCFPQSADATAWDTDVHPHDDWRDWQGWLARFHIADRLSEPGMGVVAELERLFGALEQPSEPAAEVDAPGVAPSSSGAHPGGAAPEPAARRARRPPAWMLDKGWFELDPLGHWNATPLCPAEFRVSGPSRAEVEATLPAKMRSKKPATEPATEPPESTAELDEAWSTAAASPVAPPQLVEAGFSMNRVLRGRPGRRRNRTSRAEAMRQRLLRNSEDGDT